VTKDCQQYENEAALPQLLPPHPLIADLIRDIMRFLLAGAQNLQPSEVLGEVLGEVFAKHLTHHKLDNHRSSAYVG